MFFFLYPQEQKIVMDNLKIMLLLHAVTLENYYYNCISINYNTDSILLLTYNANFKKIETK
jgi:hypothetical protein